jgi:hypothetical protein
VAVLVNSSDSYTLLGTLPFGIIDWSYKDLFNRLTPSTH